MSQIVGKMTLISAAGTESTTQIIDGGGPAHFIDAFCEMQEVGGIVRMTLLSLSQNGDGPGVANVEARLRMTRTTAMMLHRALGNLLESETPARRSPN